MILKYFFMYLRARNKMSRIWSLFKVHRQLNIYKFDVKRVLQEVPKHFASYRGYTSSVEDHSQANLEFDVTELAKGDEVLKRKLQVLLLEVDVWRQEGGRVPPTLKPYDWMVLSTLDTKARRSYLEFCWKKNISKQNLKLKKEEQKLKREQELKARENIPDDPMEYGLGKNSFFIRIGDSAMNNFYNARLIQTMLFGQDVVIDCGFDQNMTVREQINCAKQLMLLFSKNRFHNQPFNLNFCNVEKENRTMQDFIKIVPTAYEKHFPLNISEKSYLDLFPKERLVYLTPHCREELEHFDHNAIYIIGALVDKINGKPLTLAKAKEQGIKMAKFPLDKHISFSSGSRKSLTLDQVISIMLDLRQTGNWKVALQHVPSRKVQQIYTVDYNADKFKLVGDRFSGPNTVSISKRVKLFSQ